MKVGVYVGSFNPVHNGHKMIMDYLLEKKYLDKIIVIPTLSYWDKNNLIDIKDRINMLKYLETDKIIINTTLNKYEYTYEVLDELSKHYNDLYLIIGADNLEKFHLWKNVDKILEHKILVINRNSIDVSKYINKDNFILINGLDEIDISSTYIRENINKKEIENIIDKDVLKYIKDNKLYEVDNEKSSK